MSLIYLTRKTMILSFVFMLICFSNDIECMHFNGGIIRWEPVATYNHNVTSITIIQTYSWAYPTIKCSTDVPTSTPGRSGENRNLNCMADCSTDGGYSSKKISTLTDCQSSSSSLGLMTSQRSVNINLTTGAHFYLSHVGAAWAPINDPAQDGLQWSITTLIDLRFRPDGILNTPPTASVVSPQYAIVNRTTTITIPVSDVNSGDDVRCRWSTYTVGYRRRRSYDEESKFNFYRSQAKENSFLEKKFSHNRQRRDKNDKDPCKDCTTKCKKDCLCTCSGCSGTVCYGAKCVTTKDVKECPVGTTTLETPGTTKSTSSYPIRQSIDECGGICYPNGLPTGTTLSGCTITFTGLVSGTWYVAAIQVRRYLLFTNKKINLIC